MKANSVGEGVEDLEDSEDGTKVGVESSLSPPVSKENRPWRGVKSKAVGVEKRGRGIREPSDGGKDIDLGLASPETLSTAVDFGDPGGVFLTPVSKFAPTSK